MAGIEYAARLDQQQLDLVFRVRLVLHTLRDDEHLARRQLDDTIGSRSSITDSRKCSVSGPIWPANT